MYVYIMGRGHSGSTILDIILGSSAAVESLGELVSGLGRCAAGEQCSCGSPMRECVFWCEVRRRFEAQGYGWDEFVGRSRAATSVRRWPSAWLAPDRSAGHRQLAAMTEAFGRAVAQVSGKAHVLDSNKETARGLFLLQFQPDARVIHLVRDPRDVLRSHYWRVASGRGFRFMRQHWSASGWTAYAWLLLAAACWTAGNMLCELARRRVPGRTLRLRYEDLRDDPAGTVRRIAAEFELPLEDVACRLEHGDSFTVGHNVGGNPIRHQDAIRFESRTDQDRQPLPAWLEATTSLICWPLMRFYGYGLGAPRHKVPIAYRLERPGY
jgi:Sulfotransferase family